MKNKENQNIPVQNMTIEATELYYAFIHFLNFGY